MANINFKHYGLLILAAFSLAACSGGGGGNSGTATQPELSTIEVTSSQTSIVRGATLSLVAISIYSDGSSSPLTSEATWQSSDENVATVDSTGEVSAISAGEVMVQAGLDGITGSIQLSVTPSLSSLEFTPASVRLAKGTRQSLSLTGHFSNGSTQDVVEQATITVTDTTIASLNTPVTSGELLLTGLIAGSTILNASLGDASTQIAVTVSAASLIQLVISPESSVLPLGTTLNLSVQGLYSDNSSQTLTQQVVWNSSDTGILTIDDTGVLHPQAVGSSTITASLAGITAIHTASVSEALLTSIEVNTTLAIIPTGNQQQITALGHYNDGSLQDITEQVTWLSTPGDRLSISNVAGSRGLSTALDSGPVTVTATLGVETGSLDLMVSAATLSSIELSPLKDRLAAGTRSGFIATGRYTDSSIQDISEQVSWASSDPDIASVSNVAGERGQTLALVQGAVTVSVSLDGKTASASLVVTAAELLSINIVPAELTLPVGTFGIVSAQGSFSDGSVQNLDDVVTWETDKPGIAVVANGKITALQSALDPARISATWQEVTGTSNVTVSNATLNSLLISPTSPVLAIGTETQLRATAIYSDSSEEDVTTQATWSSSDDSLARTDNSLNNEGRLSALAIGNLTVTASFNGIQISESVTVTDASLDGLRITSPVTSLDSAGQQQLTAIGDFSDGSTQDLTSAVIWSSDSPTVAHVSNNGADRGNVVAGIDISGTAVISASYKGYSPTISLTINNTPQKAVSLVAIATPNVINNNGIDASTIEIRVQAASPGSKVIDGTVINLQIIQAGIVTSDLNLTTTNGVASTGFSTLETGFFKFEASIVDTTVRNSTLLYASSTIYDVIAGAAFANIQRSGNQILTGTRFGISMLNLSNRTFPLLEYKLLNGTDIVFSTIAPEVLNDNMFSGGSKVSAIYTTEGPLTDKGIVATFILIDPSTGIEISFSVQFTGL